MHPRAREFKEQVKDAYDITPEIREFPEGTKTAADAANAIGCELTQIVKSIVMIANDEMIVILTSGVNRVSTEKLAAELDVPEETVRSANADEVRETIGWSIGGVPPFCHETTTSVFLDETLTEYETVWAAAGTPEAVFAISLSALHRYSDATLADVFDYTTRASVSTNTPSDRLQNIPGFSIDEVADAVGDDPEVLRLENLDTDLEPPAAAIDETQATIGEYRSNSYLPFIGHVPLREIVCAHLNDQTGNGYAVSNAIITAGGTEGMLDALLATINSKDEVVLTDPTYAGMINRVRLADGDPALVPFVVRNGEWRLDLDHLRATVSDRTRMLFIMNPSMPSGAVLTHDEWEVLADLCCEHDCWLLYNAAMERILFDNREVTHPASLPGMAERTITVGSVSKEYRMIGWRVGWVVGPEEIIDDIARTHIYNVVTPPGIAQVGAFAALQHDTELTNCVNTWEARRNVVTDELSDYETVPAAGGWSQLLNVGEQGYDAGAASELLIEKGKIAATPMTVWGEENSDQFVRIVFSNESVERLEELGDRVAESL